MNRLKRLLRPYNVLLLGLCAGFLFPVYAQSQELESLTATAKGHGVVSSAVDERKITSVLVVLRQDGTLMITLTADCQLQAQGTWSTSASSPEAILLKITGGVLKGEMTGSGKLVLTSDKKSFKELTTNVKLSDGQKVTVTFVADASEPSETGPVRTNRNPITTMDPTQPPGTTRSPSVGIDIRAMKRQRRVYESDVRRSQK